MNEKKKRNQFKINKKERLLNEWMKNKINCLKKERKKEKKERKKERKKEKRKKERNLKLTRKKTNKWMKICKLLKERKKQDARKERTKESWQTNI